MTIHAEALIGSRHTLLLVVEAPSRDAVERFFALLPGADQLQILAAVTAEEAVDLGGCGP